MEREHMMLLPAGYPVKTPNGGRFVIDGLLGKGGSSAVYRVRNRQDRSEMFALKEVIDPSRQERERLIFEWSVLKRLSHPALPQVYQVFDNKNLRRVYILMRYVEGQDLERLRKSQPDHRFSLPLVLALLEPVVDAIRYLHSQEPAVVHRDVKPANIVVPMGAREAVLVDFSIAKEYEPEATTTAVRRGSPGYAAPEQYGAGTSPRTDIYGLAATIYTLLTGVVPVDAITRLTSKKGADPLKTVAELVPDISVEVSDVIQRAMSVSWEDRYASIDDFWEALRDAAQGKEASPEDIAALSRASRLTPRVLSIDEMKTANLLLPRPKGAIRRRALAIVLPLIILLVVGAAMVYGLSLQRGQNAHVSPTPTITSVAKASPTHTGVSTAPYPPLAAAYNGTVVDLVGNTRTPMQLTGIQQERGTIRGAFQGLGQQGTFHGTVDKSGHIQFTVSVYSGASVLAFDGAVKLGGTMAGSFEVRNQNGQRTGESGLWSVMPLP